MADRTILPNDALPKDVAVADGAICGIGRRREDGVYFIGVKLGDHEPLAMEPEHALDFAKLITEMAEKAILKNEGKDA